MDSSFDNPRCVFFFFFFPGLLYPFGSPVVYTSVSAWRCLRAKDHTQISFHDFYTTVESPGICSH